jgi:hypothetical protein
MWFDPFLHGRIEGRRYVAREGRDEYLHPNYLPGQGDDRGRAGEGARAHVPRTVVAQLIVMATVMIATLVALILIFA